MLVYEVITNYNDVIEFYFLEKEMMIWSWLLVIHLKLECYGLESSIFYKINSLKLTTDACYIHILFRLPFSGGEEKITHLYLSGWIAPSCSWPPGMVTSLFNLSFSMFYSDSSALWFLRNGFHLCCQWTVFCFSLIPLLFYSHFHVYNWISIWINLQ